MRVLRNDTMIIFKDLGQKLIGEDPYMKYEIH
jgi:hypothetical protein